MEERPSTARLALKWGLITGVGSIVLSTLIFVTEQSQNSWVSAINYLIIIGGLALAMRDYKRLNAGYMTYSEGLGLGTLTSAIAGILTSMYTVVYLTFIDPGLMERTMDKLRDRYEEQGLSDTQIDQIMDMSQKFQNPSIQFILGILGAILMGFLFSLLVAAILRKNKPVFE